MSNGLGAIARATALWVGGFCLVSQAGAITSTTTTLDTLPAVASVGQALTLSASVSKPTVGYAPGSVVFKDGATTLKTVALSSGKALYTLPAFTATGSHSYVATYSSSSLLIAASSSAAQAVAVKYATTTTLALSSTSGRAGQAIVLVASVASTVSGGTPKGTVTFTDGSTTLGTVAVQSGKATLTTSLVSEGTHSLRASYAADATTQASTSATVTAQLTGRDYFVASGAGASDSNLGTETSPWATLAKVATLKLTNRADVAAKQSVRLQCGSEWREQLNLTAANVVDASKDTFEIGQWGVCLSTNRPLINSAVRLQSGGASWKKVSGSIYQYEFKVGEIPGNVMQLFIRNGSNFVQLQEARHPNVGYLTIEGVATEAGAETHKDILKTSEADNTFIKTGRVDPLKGAGVHVRTSPYSFEDRLVYSYADSAADARLGVLTFGAVAAGSSTISPSPLGYDATQGYGYVLTGKDWMIDTANEWSYDASTRTLKLWAPGGVDPNTLVLEASVYGYGILAKNVPVRLSNLAVRLSTQDGVSVNAAPNSVLDNLDVAYAGRNGLALDFEPNIAVLSSGTVVSNNKVAFSRDTGIATGWAMSQMSVLNNTVTDTGTALEPHHTLAAIVVSAGSNGRSLIQGNTVQRSAYAGIMFTSTSLSSDPTDQASKTQVTGNLVEDFCSRLDDCGGIYTYNGNGILGVNIKRGAVVANNVVRRGQGDLSGTSETRLTGVTGLYMDDYTESIYLHDNVVTETENGIVLHNNVNDRVEQNTVLAVRKTCVYLDNTGEDAPAANLSVSGNTCVAGGTYARQPTNGEDVAVTQRTANAVILGADGQHPINTFGTVYKFSNNSYASLYGGSTFQFQEFYQNQFRNLNIQGWSQLAEAVLTGSDANTPLLSPYRVTQRYGSNLVANGDMSADPSSSTLVGWDNSSSVKPQQAADCGSTPASACATRVTDPADGRSTDQRSRTAPLSLTPGLTYELALRMRTPNGPVRITLDVGTPCRPSVWAYLMAPSAGWTQVKIPFVASSQLGYNDSPANCIWGNNNAVQFDVATPAGQLAALKWDDVALQQVDVAYGTTSDDYRILINRGDTAQAQACPDDGTSLSARCAQYVDLNRKAITWPLTVPAHGGKLVVWTGSAFYNAQ
jgi:hypothetical protein